MRFLHSRFRTRSLCAAAVGIALFTAVLLMGPAPR